jgi:ElaB/YqjD/DUF883 family membrane-anchored ribosome-binding protein
MARHGMAELREMAQDLGETAGSAGGQAMGTLRRGSRRAGSELSHLWSQIERLFDRDVAPAARYAADQAEPYWREGRDMAADAAVRLRNAANARPLLAVGIAIAATYVVTSMLHGRRGR